MCHTFDGQNDHWNHYDYQRDRGWPPTCRIDRAQQSLNGLTGVGFIENIEPTLAAWLHFFGMSAQAGSSLYAHSHKTSGNHGFQNLSARVQMAIVQTSREDVILHRWARDKFDAPRHEY